MNDPGHAAVAVSIPVPWSKEPATIRFSVIGTVIVVGIFVVAVAVVYSFSA